MRFAAAVVATGLAFAASGAGALEYVVTKTDDTADGSCDADCSLREAISAANLTVEADTITIPAGVFVLSIAGVGEDQNATGDLDVRESTLLQGAGRDLTVIDAGGVDRVLELPHSGTIEVRDATLRGGRLAVTNGCGIRNSSTALLTLRRVRITDNRCTGGDPVSDNGGGVYVDFNARLSVYESLVDGNLAERSAGIGSIGQQTQIFDSTIRNNVANVSGGGVGGYGDWTISRSTIDANQYGAASFGSLGTIHVYASTISGNVAWAIRSYVPVFIDNSTIVRNQAFEALGAFGSGAFHLKNTIVVNDLLVGGAECAPAGVTNSHGFNYTGDASCGSSTGDQVGADPMLTILWPNGGPTRTHHPLPGSPVIDAGASGGCTDIGGFFGAEQRGEARVVDGDGDSVARCDIGSVEYAPEPDAALAGLAAAALLAWLRRRARYL
jgi:CSLREA domain-containing protein